MPGIHLSAFAGDLLMRCNAQNTRPNFFLKTVHHRQHDDERGDAQRDAQHGDHRDERNEVVATLGAGVTQTDEKFVRAQDEECKN